MWLGTLLREREAEIGQAVLARVYGVSDPAAVDDPEYVHGLRAAVSAALAYGIAGIDGRPEHPPPIPPQLLAQARFAARSGVSLDTVLRRYFAGYALLGDFVIQTVEESGTALGESELRRLWRSEATLFDRLVAAVAEAHTVEAGERQRSTRQRRVELVGRLLDGELLDASELRYELDGWHLAVIARGPGGPQAVRKLAAQLDRSLLIARPGGETVWAWLGGVRRLCTEEALACAHPPGGVSLAWGEPGEGIEGWRLTHNQARAAASVAMQGSEKLVRYADVALLVTLFRDEVLARSLQELYLKPLGSERDGGEALRQTLRAFFAADRNVSSAASALGVTRQTVNRRLRSTEEKIGRSLDVCAAEMETVLRFADLGGRPGVDVFHRALS
jgi:hypothetical protein